MSVKFLQTPNKAAEHGRASVIRYLGRKNADVNMRGGMFGGTPLQNAGKLQ